MFALVRRTALEELERHQRKPDDDHTTDQILWRDGQVYDFASGSLRRVNIRDDMQRMCRVPKPEELDDEPGVS